MKQSDWVWFGGPGHFICSFDCRFHLCTKVGDYLVSTVGEYFPDSPVREIYATSRKITLEGKGDARKADYMKRVGYEEIGCGRKYETMVFLAGKPCASKECGCGLPAISGSELDFEGYNDARAANAGHLDLCKKWSKCKPAPVDAGEREEP